MINVLTINWTNKEGSTVEIIRCIEDELRDKCRFIHCFQVGEKKQESDFKVTSWNITRGYYLLARLTGIKYGQGNIPTKKLIRYIEKNAPDVIHFHCPNFYNLNLYMLLEYLKKSEIPTVITNHAEFFYTGNCAYAFDCSGYLSGCKKCDRQFDSIHPYLFNRTAYEWKKMKKVFEGANTFIMTVVSGWQKERIEKSPITQNIPVVLIENGVDTEVFKYKPCESNSIREDFKHVVTHVTSDFNLRTDSIKGGCYLIKLAEQMPDTLFLVLGPYYKTEKDIIPNNVRIIGHVDKEKLSEYYNISDVTVLTSKRETFGMACAESMCCGTPVAAFKAGGTESIAIKEWSRFAEFGDVSGLKKCVEELLDLKETKSSEISEDAIKKYSVHSMVNSFYKLYMEMVEKTGKKENLQM